MAGNKKTGYRFFEPLKEATHVFAYLSTCYVTFNVYTMQMFLRSIIAYKSVAVVAFIALSVVQFFLVYNTYRLKDDHYFLSEKNILDDEYSRSIRNDKVFPGGQTIIDSFIYRNMHVMEALYGRDTAQFRAAADKLSDSIFTQLRLANNMDSLFSVFVHRNKLGKDLQYVLTVSSVSIAFSVGKYVPLFQTGRNDPLLGKSIQMPVGVIIGGDLKHPDNQNLVTHLSVSAPTAHSYQITFNLYVDTPNRCWRILKQMTPVFLLSLFSLLLVVLIYFFTFRNWLRQKKLAEMQSDFVNSITHELNTPLSTIIVANKNLQTDQIAGNRAGVLALTKIIDRQSQRLKVLFNQVMDLTKMNAHSLNREDCLLGDLLEEILLDYRLSVIDKRVRIVLNGNNLNPLVSLDKFAFTTVLTNIFENAIKYNSNEQKSVVVDLSENDSDIRIDIKDNGIGIPPEILNHIFDKFYRAKNRQNKEVSGLGLGLFYVIQSVKAHGWQIEVNSEMDKGSDFRIIISKVS